MKNMGERRKCKKMMVKTFEESKLGKLEDRVNDWLSMEKRGVIDIKLTSYGSDAVASRYVVMIVYDETA